MSRLAPVLLLSLLVHMALLYGARRLTLRHVGVEQAADSVVAYLDLCGPTRRSEPAATARGAVAPVAAMPRPVAPAAVATPPASAAPFTGAPKGTSSAVPPAAAAPPGTGASSRDAVSHSPGNRQAAGHPAEGGAEALGRETAGLRAAAPSPGAMPGAPPVAAAPRAKPGIGNGAREVRGSYQALLKRLIEARKEYPLAARKSGREGSCRRRFVLRRDGSLQQVETVTSCGHPFLDAAASRAVSSVGTFPPPPAELSLEEPFEVTISFVLAGK
ncbi:energy transducer TonB [Geomonas agri]|uniref:energy transducer TonB n=1 Tax=Geomonas agri TaxID=2873702 RepID=UPI001CD7AA95|nr:energy transducer TonB [Geomonas agri]